ncbi:reverse transcriptase domain-containing protein [Tanacetum coccineum]
MPKYAKYLKSLLTNKSRLEEACTVTMNERCSTLMLNKPSKEKDPGSFIIPCQVSDLRIDSALADLGASINIPKNSRIPIILGRPFLATAQAMIDVFNKKITLRVGDDEVIFDMDQSMKNPPSDDDEYSFVLEDLAETIDQTDVVDCGDVIEGFVNNSDIDKSIRHIDSIKNDERRSLLHVLEKHKGAIAWKMLDIKGISSSFCTHKILMEDVFKLVIQPQRCLNPKVQKAFNILKEKLTTAPIIISPDWNIPFKLMCDASDYAVGVVLG